VDHIGENEGVRSSFWRDLRPVPMIWRVAIGIVIVISAVMMQILTAELHIPKDSWLGVLTGIAPVVPVIVVLRFLLRKNSN
jgi:hypothetical protein